MKGLILLVAFFSFIISLGACSSKTTSFDEGEKEQVSSSSDTNGEEGQKQAESEPQSVEDVDKAVDMGDQGLSAIEGVQRSEAVCRKENDERIIQVIDTREGHCGVTYTKFGKKKTMAFARYEMTFCDKIQKSIVNNLVGADFDCGSAGPEPVGEMEVTIKGKTTSTSDSESEQEAQELQGNSENKKPVTPLPKKEEAEENGQESQPRQEEIPSSHEEEQQPVEKESSVGDDHSPSLREQGENLGEDETDEIPSVEGVEQGQMMDRKSGLPTMDGSERSGMVCVRDDDERVVSVVDTVEGHCGVNYTKSGKTETKAYAKYDMSLCDEVFNKIIGNLVGSGFECRGAGYSAQ